MRVITALLSLTILFLLLIYSGQFLFQKLYIFPQKITYGVTFSPQNAKYLGLDFKKVFIASLDELKIRNFRIPTYWEDIEEQEGKFNFDDVDFMLSETGKRGARVLLVMGARQPRWPECHFPFWALKLSLPQRQKETLDFIKNVLERYKDNTSIWGYQVENEPFLPYFGEHCDNGDTKFLKEEVALVKSISNKPIVISDSGELGVWIVPMKDSDIFGTTLYRHVYNSILGYVDYPILPYLYNLKSQLIRGVFAPNNQKTIIVELQAEPWIGTTDLMDNSKKQSESLSLEKLKSYIDYAKKTGFDTAYLWGLEWWFWMAKNGHPQYLEYAKQLF